jgi:ABC-type polysaccharide/polyol phosphate export permease
MVRDVIRHRDLLYMLAWRDICIRYKQSILGILWAVLMPTAIVLAGVVVKLALAKVSGAQLARHDLALVTVKAVPWAFFVAAIRSCTLCLIANSNLVTRTCFPKVVLPLAAVLSSLFDMLVALGVAAIVIVCLGIEPALPIAWLPILILLLVALAAGLGIFLAAAALFFRDVKYMVELFLTFAIFFTPVFFEVALFNEWRKFLLLNPAAPILEAFAVVVVHQRMPALTWLAYSSTVSILVFVGSCLFFRKCEPAFAERI